jgi:hypothetical protein
LKKDLKYLGFLLKPNDYRKTDWRWLIEKLEKRLKCWSHRWLSRAGRLVLIKSVLEAIPVYWMSLAWIPKGTLDKMRKLCFTYLWQGNKDKKKFTLGKMGTDCYSEGPRWLGAEEYLLLLYSSRGKMLLEVDKDY